MARLISGTGVNGNVTIGSPQEGTRWIVRWAVVLLQTTTTSGTRNATLVAVRGGNANNAGAVLATTTNQTGTDMLYAGTGDVTNQQANNVNSTYFYQFPEIFAVDTIQLFVTLVSGDLVDYYILVDEVSS